MTRKEMINYLIDNPTKKAKCVKNILGDNITTKQITVNINEYGMLVYNDTSIVPVYQKDDKSEWEIVTEEITFSEAYKVWRNGIPIKSLVTNEVYDKDLKNLCTDKEIDGLWEVMK